MSFSMFQILGNCGQDAEVRETEKGTKIASVSVALNSGWGDKKRTHWVKAKAFGKLAESLGKLKKGQRVLVSGDFDVEEWNDKQGQKRVQTVCLVNRVTFIDREEKEEEAPW